jgi:dolichyl-diphosphooligosaccharide--protein glycosyltransferase
MTRARPPRALWLWLGLFGSAFLLRIANLGFVFADGRVRFPSGRDELYHVRKIVYQVARFPEVLDFDPYVSFPFGATPVWPPFLDWVIAAAVRLLATDALAVERLIVWLPPLLGAATVALLGEVGRRHFSALAGLVAGLWLVLLPAHHMHSQLGQVDHQVVLGLATVLLLGAAMAWLATPGASRRRSAWAAAVGLVSALALLVSPGALLSILPVEAAAVVWALAAVERAEAVARARSAAFAHGVAALLVTPACLASGPFAELGAHSPLVLSGFQPLWLGAVAVGLAAVAEVWRRSGAGAGRAARAGAALALAAVAGGSAFALIPGLRGSLSYAGGWFTREEAFLSTVAELQPLLFPAGRFDPGFALRSLSAGLFVFPLAWLWLALRRGLDPNARPALALLLVWSAAFFGLALAQERFANAFAPGLALTLGAALEELRASAGRRFPRRAFAAVAALLPVAALAPSLLDYRQLIAYSRYALRQEHPLIPADSRRQVVVEDAARFLRETSPPTRGFLAAELQPEYGVLTSWDDGHLVRYRAERPTVQDNFGSFADRRAWDLARAYFDAEDEEEAVRAAEQLGARYTVATREGSGQSFGPSPHSVGQRLWLRLGNGMPAADGAGSPALARHRLCWVGDRSGRPRELTAPAPDRVAVFEIVAGALVTGAAPPGARVSVELELQAGAGRLWYRARAQASPEGRYEIRLPYPTDREVSREVRAAGVYRVRSGGRSAGLELREEEVRAGARVPGPNLREEGA